VSSASASVASRSASSSMSCRRLNMTDDSLEAECSVFMPPAWPSAGGARANLR
jgi:hypothetical protein